MTDAEQGRDGWLRGVRHRFALVLNPLIGRSVPIDTTVPLQLRVAVDDSFARRGWQESDELGSGALGERPGGREERKRRRAQRRARAPERAQPIVADVQELLNRFEHLILLGDPGSGKTTLLRRLAHSQALEALGAMEDRPRMPLYVSCVDLAARLMSRPRTSLIDALAESVQADSLAEGLSAGESGRARTMIAAKLDRDHVLLLIDGLDEVDGDERARVLEALRAVRDNQVILTMRPAALRVGALPGWTVCELQPLDREQRQALLRSLMRAFGAQYGTGQDSSAVQRELDGRPDLRAWAGNPLLLTLVASQYRAGGALPAEVAKLYEFAVEELTDQRRSTAVRKLTRLELDQCMRRIALAMMQHNLG